MIGVKYPLRYFEGGVAVDSDRQSITISEIKHFLDTLRKERVIFSNFGVRIEILFDTNLPELFAAGIDVDLKEVIPSDVQYEVSVVDFKDGKLTLRLDFISDQQVADRIRGSLINIYAANPQN